MDVVSPLMRKAAAGPFTLLRNSRTVTRAWRRSKDAQRVLIDPQYYGFDEWWGKSRHHFVAVLEELNSAGQLRVKKGGWRWCVTQLRGWPALLAARFIFSPSWVLRKHDLMPQTHASAPPQV